MTQPGLCWGFEVLLPLQKALVRPLSEALFSAQDTHVETLSKGTKGTWKFKKVTT